MSKKSFSLLENKLNFQQTKPLKYLGIWLENFLRTFFNFSEKECSRTNVLDTNGSLIVSRVQADPQHPRTCRTSKSRWMCPSCGNTSGTSGFGYVFQSITRTFVSFWKPYQILVPNLSLILIILDLFLIISKHI